MALAWAFFPEPCSRAADPPPPACGASPSHKLEVQLSLNGGATWQGGTVYLQVRPAQTLSIMARTRLTVTTGATQGWSFGLKHDDSYFQYYGGGITLTAVTTDGTQTATAKGGAPADVDETALRPGHKGFTQGVIVDGTTEVTLPPVTNFVTALACYSLTAPSSQTTIPVPFKFLHTVGSPPIHSEVTQGGAGVVPCAQNATLQVSVSPYAYPPPGGCSISGGAQAAQGGPEGEDKPFVGAAPGEEQAAGAGGPGICIRFQRGDANDSGSLDVSDAVFTLNFLFTGGPAPGCEDAMDTDDDGRSTITDAIRTLGFLFMGGPAPAPPLGSCGEDPTADDLTCVTFASCEVSVPAFVELGPATTPSFATEFMASKDVQLADFDGDGDLDAYVPQSRAGPCQPDHVYVNRIDEAPSRLEVRADLALAGDHDGMGNWVDLGMQNNPCGALPWPNDCTGQPAGILCAYFETTYASAVADLGSPGGGPPDGKPDIVNVGGSDFLRILINDSPGGPGAVPSFVDESGELIYDSAAAGGQGGWKPDPADTTRRVFHSVAAPPGSGLPAEKNAIDLLGPLVTDTARLLVNPGEPWFHYTSPFHPMDSRTSLDDVDVGDLDMDGDLDIVVANRDKRIYAGQRSYSFLLRNRGGGVFDTFELDIPGHDRLLSTHDIALGDVDGDGDLDMVFANDARLDEGGETLQIPAPAELFRNLAAQTVNPGSVPHPRALFEKVAGAAVEGTTNCFHAAMVDLDGDGDVEIHLDGGLSSASGLGFYWNQGGGAFTFQASPVPGNLYTAAYGDLNLDGWADMVAVSANQGRVYLSDCGPGGQLAWVEAVGALPPVNAGWSVALGVALGDLDGDTDLDIIVSQGDSGLTIENRVFLNQIVP